LFSEDIIGAGGGRGYSGVNPFKPETRNLTAINQLAASDPELARRLAKEAGVDPDHWLGRKR
jgi:hypothetical protein